MDINWIVVFLPDVESPIQVFPYDEEEDALKMYERLTINWTEVFMCKVVRKCRT